MGWTFQGWLAMFFTGAGYAKLTAPYEHMTLLLGWPAWISPMTLQLVGAVELLLAASLLAPLLMGWKSARPIVVTGAALLIILQATALVVHAMRFEPALAFVNMVLMALTGTVLVLRRNTI